MDERNKSSTRRASTLVAASSHSPTKTTSRTAAADDLASSATTTDLHMMTNENGNVSEIKSSFNVIGTSTHASTSASPTGVMEDTIMTQVPTIGLLQDEEQEGDIEMSAEELDPITGSGGGDDYIDDDEDDDGLNEVDDTPRMMHVIGEEDDDEDDEEVNVNAGVNEELQQLVPSVSDDEDDADDLSQSSEEVNTDPHCYCRFPWSGENEKMIECEKCTIWFHFDWSVARTSHTEENAEKNQGWRKHVIMLSCMLTCRLCLVAFFARASLYFLSLLSVWVSP